VSDAGPIVRLNAALEGRYRIERELGEGGMATVYLARDERHNRNVALKVLKPELAAVVGAERFLAEIETTANLQHPHILPLFDSGEADGFLFYVMPFVEGESLRERLDRERQLPVDDAVRMATNVAEALDYAHRRGVVHRDIKPANILLQDGKPVVSDFGIALAVGAAGGGRLTETGLSLGTPHYMSPEQATGDVNVGTATDLYSLACVLYEMLGGEPPYTGSTPQAVLGKIVTGHADSVTSHRKSVPPNVDAAIQRALEKIPADRFGSPSAFAAALNDPGFRHLGMDAEEPGGQLASRVAAGAFVALASVGLGWALGRSAEGREVASGPPVVRFTIAAPGGYENTISNEVPSLAVSPDSRTVVWRENGVLMRRHLDEEDATVIPGTEDAELPFFSPDGSWLAFFQDHRFWRVSAAGAATSFTDASPDWIHGADWSEDDAVLYGRNALGIWRAPVGGGEPGPITDPARYPDEQGHVWPQSLAGGSLVLYTALGISGKWHDAQVVLHDLDRDERVTVVRGGAYARYVPSGHIVYAREEGVIQAMPFSLEERIGGEPVPIESGVYLGQFAAGAGFVVSPSGALVFVRGDNSRLHLLRWYDREGRQLGQFGPPRTVAWGLEFDPTGTMLAAALPNNRNDDIYILEPDVVTPRRMSFGPGGDGWPVWSPDGTRIAWDHVDGVAVRDVDGEAEPVIVYETDGGVWPRSWSPDGRWVLFSERLGSGQDMLAVNMDDPDEVVTVVDSPSEEWDGQFSPDGSLIAFDYSEGGTFTTFVTTFPNPSEPVPVTDMPAQHPRWSPTRDELYFWSGRTLMAARYRTVPRFTVESVDSLFSVPGYFLSVDPYYNITPDGERFLVQEHNPDAEIREIHVVLNWFEELLERAPN
jgi:Tol biopolymer transport system component